MFGNRGPTEPVSPPPSETNDREVVFDVLRDATRRRVLHRLDTGEGWVGLGDLAERVADADQRDPDRIAAALHHNHLPKLAECGLVEYDHLNRRVAAADLASVELYLGLFED